MSDDQQKQAADEGEATRKRGNTGKDAAKDTGSSDPFILEKVFKDAVKVFSATAPADLHDHAVYVLDTNALLAPFKMGAKPAADIASVLDRLANEFRLYVPARAAREFARRRPDMLIAVYNDLHGFVNRLAYESKECPMLEDRPSYMTLQEASKALQEAVRNYKRAMGDVLKEIADWHWEDSVSGLYHQLFTTARVIDHDLSDEELLNDLRRRFNHHLPPGFKDAGKEDQGVGDVAIWHSILKIGEKSKKSVIFVSDEMKPDWVVRTQGTAISARAELAYEFFDRNSNHFTIVSFSEFLEKTGAKPETVKEAAIVEIQEALPTGSDPNDAVQLLREAIVQISAACIEFRHLMRHPELTGRSVQILTKHFQTELAMATYLLQEVEHWQENPVLRRAYLRLQEALGMLASTTSPLQRFKYLENVAKERLESVELACANFIAFCEWWDSLSNDEF